MIQRERDLKEWQRLCASITRYEKADEEEVDIEEYEKVLDRWHFLKEKYEFTPLDMPEDE